MTAMVLLTANNMHKPKHNDLSLDSKLVETALHKIDTMAKETKSEAVESFQVTCTELHQRTQQRCAELAMMANNVNYPSTFWVGSMGLREIAILMTLKDTCMCRYYKLGQ